MPQDISALSLPLPFRMGRVNCYLIPTAAGYVLIDTGGSNARKELHGQLNAPAARQAASGLSFSRMGISITSATPPTCARFSEPRSQCAMTIRAWPNAGTCS